MADQGVTTTFCDGLLEAGNGTPRSLGLLLCSVSALLRAVFCSFWWRKINDEHFAVSVQPVYLHQCCSECYLCKSSASPLLFLFHWTPIDPFCVLHFISFGKLKRKYTLSMFLMEESFIIQAFVRFGIPIQLKFFYDMVWNWFLCQAGSVLPGSSVIGFCFISFFQVRGVGWVRRLGLAILFLFWSPSRASVGSERP